MHCMPQVVVRITDAQMAWIESQVEQFRPKSVVVRDLIDSAMKGVDTVGTIPTCRAGAGHQSDTTQRLPLQFPPGLEVTSSQPPTEAVKAVPKKNLPDLVVPQCVFHHSDLIQEFWKTKKGSKSETAWKLLMTELTKISNQYGSERVDEQLRLAINGRWQSITLRNMQNFEKTPRQQPQQKMSLTEEARSLGLI